MIRQRIPVQALLDHERQVGVGGPPAIIVRLIHDDIGYSVGEGGDIWRRVLRQPISLAQREVEPIYDFRWVPVNWTYPVIVPYTRRPFWSTVETIGGAVMVHRDGRVVEVPEEMAQRGLLAPEAPLVLV